jgi:NitT/TauT family transport system substrate-binding protein
MRLLIAALAVGAVLLAGCAGAPAPADRAQGTGTIDCAPLDTPTDITVGSSSTVAIATSLQAEGNGLYEKENLRVRNETFQSGQDMIALVGRGQLDAGIGGFSANYFSAVSQGVEVYLVGSQGRLNPADLASGFYVRSQLLDDGTVTSVADLRGKNIAFPGNNGSGAAYLASLLLAQGGVSLNDIQQTPLTYADIPAALANGSIDAAWIGSPFSKAVERDGTGRRIGDQSVFATEDLAAIYIGPNFLRDNQRAGCAFLRANIMAGRGPLAPGANQRPETVAAFVAAGLPEDLVRSTPDYTYEPTLEVSRETVERMQKLYMEVGVLKLDAPLPYEQVVPEDFRQQVIASLNP